MVKKKAESATDALPAKKPARSAAAPKKAKVSAPKKKAAPQPPVAEPAASPSQVAVPAAADMKIDHVIIQQPEALLMARTVYQLWLNCAGFELLVKSPLLLCWETPKIIASEPLDGGGEEFVYPIHDYGNRWTTSKQEEILSAGKSMCKLYYTIEKIMALLIQRLQEGGIDTDTEVQVEFQGHEQCKRKGFEVVINLKHNVVVSNFDPGAWGGWYLKAVQNLHKKGLGYPDVAPRDIYKQLPGAAVVKLRGASGS